MTISRTSNQTVTFRHPFQLSGFKDLFPAGKYVVDTTEELIESVSITAYRRVSTELHLRTKINGMMSERILSVTPTDLDAALAKDAAFLDAPSTPTDIPNH